MPTDLVHSDDPAVADPLRRIVELLRAHGAEMNPALRVIAQDGDLSLECGPAAAEGDLLIDLPPELLIPTEDLVFTDSAEELELVEEPGGLTAVQRELLDLHIDLYNDSDKIPFTERTHPRRNLHRLPGTIEVLQRFRPSFQAAVASPAEVFINTRVLSAKRPDSDERRRAKVIMPLIDLLNHHPAGAPFEGKQGDLKIQVRRIGGQQCFAQYAGRKDVLDLGLGYGYLDEVVTEAGSGTIRVDIPDFGQVRVRGAAPRRVSPLDPPQISVTEDGLGLSHLLFDEVNPDRFWTPLRMALQVSTARRGITDAPLDSLLPAVAESLERANVIELSALERAARAQPENAAGALVAAACRRQAAIISSVVSGREPTDRPAQVKAP